MKIGLTLGSGAARGITHIGVLKALEENNIQIDYISGSSIGALIGGAYALGMPVREIEDIALNTNWKSMAKIFLPKLSFSAFINDRYLKDFLFDLFSDKTFADLKVPLSVAAADIKTGELITFNSGALLTAIRASISIPIVFTPVITGEHRLVDGGLVNPTPVDLVKNMGAEKIIAVNLRAFFKEKNTDVNKRKIVSQKTGEKERLTLNERIEYFLKHPLKMRENGKSKEEAPPSNEMPKFGKILYQMLAIVQIQMSQLTMRIVKPDILIEPDTSRYTLYDFHKGKELIDIGYQAASEALQKKRDLLTTG